MIKILHILINLLNIPQHLYILNNQMPFVPFIEDKKYRLDVVLGYADLVFHIGDDGQDALAEFLVWDLLFGVVVEYGVDVWIVELVC